MRLIIRDGTEPGSYRDSRVAQVSRITLCLRVSCRSRAHTRTRRDGHVASLARDRCVGHARAPCARWYRDSRVPQVSGMALRRTLHFAFQPMGPA
jgi:hypothetical protein